MKQYQQIDAEYHRTGVEYFFCASVFLFVHNKIVQKQMQCNNQQIQDACIRSKPVVGRVTHTKCSRQENAH
jgi:hypothetical protein